MLQKVDAATVMACKTLSAASYQMELEYQYTDIMDTRMTSIVLLSI